MSVCSVLSECVFVCSVYVFVYVCVVPALHRPRLGHEHVRLRHLGRVLLEASPLEPKTTYAQRSVLVPKWLGSVCEVNDMN